MRTMVPPPMERELNYLESKRTDTETHISRPLASCFWGRLFALSFQSTRRNPLNEYLLGKEKDDDDGQDNQERRRHE